MRIIACIEDRQVINTILAYINRKQEPLALVMAGAGIRAPPTDPKSSINQKTKKLAVNSSVAFGRPEFKNERKWHRKMQSY